MHAAIRNSEIITDGNIKFSTYNKRGCIVKRFSKEEWHKSVFDIDNDNEWNSFLHKYEDLVKCFLIYDCKSDNIGFVYLYDEGNNAISVHGGGWVKSIGSTILYYRAMIVITSFLLSKGFKVHTSCLADNKTAFRFLKSIGFVTYEKTQKALYMWINAKRLENSKVYIKLYNKKPHELIVTSQ